MRSALFLGMIFLSIYFMSGCQSIKRNKETATVESIQNRLDVNAATKNEVKSVNFTDINSAFCNNKENVINKFGSEYIVTELNEQLISIEYNGISFLLDKANKQGVFSITVTKPISIGKKVISSGITEGELKQLLNKMNMVLLDKNEQNPVPWIVLEGLEINFIFEFDKNGKDKTNILKQVSINLGK